MGCRGRWELTVSSVFWCLHIIFLTTCTESVEKLVFIDVETTWEDAYTDCRDLNGVMVTQGDLQAFKIPQCAINMSRIWTGNVIVVTPLLSLRACVNASIDETSGYYIGQNNSVEQCAALCSEYMGFEIQKEYCRCFEETTEEKRRSDSETEPLSKVSAELCSYFCKEGEKNQFCGGENVANVYIFNERKLEGVCTFATCGVEGESALNHGDCSLDVFNTNILCKDDDDLSQFQGNVSDWLSVCQWCVVKFGTYPIESLNEQHCCERFGSCLDCNEYNSDHTLCSTTWTSTRKYRGNIFTQDTELEGFDIESCSYSLMRASKISFHMSPSCEEPGINIACKINAGDEDNFSCYTTMESTSAFVNTKDVDTSTIQTSTIFSGDSMTSTMGYTMSLSKDSDEDATPIGIIVGVILGLSVVLAVVVTIVQFRRRAMCFRGQTKKTNNKPMVYRIETDNENGVIYESAKDDEYDNLNVKRKHTAETKSQTDIYHHVTNPMVKGSSENNYDEMKHTNQRLSENTYYSHAKSPNPLLTGITGNEYDISGHVKPVNQTLSSENAYDVCLKSADPT